uniref:Uncharacterized protein n=1 Tax=Physcomitrium patens TaxID=3218 RepID=A0A2K1JL33_PHYPA|nr:hypothetical protein PHYPA_017074 [Physcomitrium patens]
MQPKLLGVFPLNCALIARRFLGFSSSVSLSAVLLNLICFLKGFSLVGVGIRLRPGHRDESITLQCECLLPSNFAISENVT